MQKAQRCVQCDADRVLIAVEWISDEYDLHSLECPNCKNVLRLVDLRSPEQSAAQAAGKTSGAATLH